MPEKTKLFLSKNKTCSLTSEIVFLLTDVWGTPLPLCPYVPVVTTAGSQLVVLKKKHTLCNQRLLDVWHISGAPRLLSCSRPGSFLWAARLSRTRIASPTVGRWTAQPGYRSSLQARQYSRYIVLCICRQPSPPPACPSLCDVTSCLRVHGQIVPAKCIFLTACTICVRCVVARVPLLIYIFSRVRAEIESPRAVLWNRAVHAR